MKPLPKLLLASLAALALPATAQQVPQQQQPQQVPQLQSQQPRPGGEDGFFRPSPDPALTRFPNAAEVAAAARAQEPAAEPIAVEPHPPREATERELDRARRDHAAATADAAARPAPMIVSPLDGTAPIVSPVR